MSHTAPRVLLVDDEPALIEGIQRNLGRKYSFSSASSGAAALRLLTDTTEPFAVIVSDFRMPEMDGVTFLREAQGVARDSTKLLLTGQWETSTAIDAVNQGNVFRFLTKPCAASALSQAIGAGVEQYRLVTSERVLLQQTLRGSIQTLVRVMALANPEAFGRANRVKRVVLDALIHLGVHDTWTFEVAAMLSQLGTIVLPPDTLTKVYRGEALSSEERTMADRLPEVALELLAEIPRLEEVREILRYHTKQFDGTGGPLDRISGEEIPLGARLLRIALDYDTIESAGSKPEEIIATLRGRDGVYDTKLVDVIAGLGNAATSANGPIRELTVSELRPGMQVVADVRSKTGMLLVARGHAVTYEMLERLRNIGTRMGISEPVRCRVP